MFNFFKKKKQQEVEEIKSEIKISPEVLAREQQELISLLDGKESYKIFSWGFGFKDGKILRDNFLPLKNWEPIEEVFTLLEKEYQNIDEGSFTLKIKDSHPSCDGDEISSLKIQIKYGYMRPYLKYRAEGETYAEEWKEYFNPKIQPSKYFEFGMDDEVAISYLTKDINLVKTIFKEFYETGDVSEDYMD